MEPVSSIYCIPSPRSATETGKLIVNGSIRATALGRFMTTEASSAEAKDTAIASSRDRLREAAKVLFAERGFEATTTPAICRLVGTSHTTHICMHIRVCRFDECDAL